MTSITPSTSPLRRALRGAAVAAVASSALVGGLLVAPAGAQTGPSATAVAVCEDGVGGIEVTIADPTDVFAFDIFIDDELVGADEAPGTYVFVGLPNGTYEVGVDGLEPEEDPLDVLTTDVTVECAAAPTTTTTVPAPTTTTPAPAAAPAAAARPEATLEFTG